MAVVQVQGGAVFDSVSIGSVSNPNGTLPSVGCRLVSFQATGTDVKLKHVGGTAEWYIRNGDSTIWIPVNNINLFRAEAVGTGSINWMVLN